MAINMSEQDRLFALMESKGVNAKEFSRETGISAATMSNILNGRNKPSLEVMQRVLNRYRNVSANWLILGIGPMYVQKTNSQADKSAEISLESVADSVPENGTLYKTYARARKNELSQAEDQNKTEKHQPIQQPSGCKQIVRVLVIYDDGTFDELNKI